jgi:hypothetical protein
VSLLRQNDTLAKSPLKLTKYNKDAMVQPDISGLYNPQFFTGARQFGVKWIISDTSRKNTAYDTASGTCTAANLVTPCNATWDNPSHNTGYRSTAEPSVFVVPRRPTNLFYNVSTREQWVDEYNCFYAPLRDGDNNDGKCAGGQFIFFSGPRTYEQILDMESDFMLKYLIKWDLDPLMFHQANLRQVGGKSLLGDLIDATMAKYNKLYNLPIQNLRLRDIGAKMVDRQTYNESGVSASLVPCSAGQLSTTLTVSVTKAATIPITGVNFGTNTEVYGGQRISYVPITPGAPAVIPVAC